MKTKEELNTLKEEIKNLNMKLEELTEDELEQVIGGVHPGISRAFTFGKLFDLNDIASKIGYIVPTEKRDVEFPPCYVWPENLTFVTPEDCAVCEYYVSCYNPDKA